MATPTRVRQLIGGVWRYVTADESAGGGGLPDPSGEPDGDVLTVDAGVPVWAPGGGSQPMLTAEVTLTNAQIKAFGTGTAYVDVVAAPGVGKGLVFHRGLITIDATAAAYTNVGNTAGTYFDFEYHGGSGASVQLGNSAGAVTEFLGGDGEVTIATFLPSALIAGFTDLQGSCYDASELENLPLSVFGVNAAAGAYTGGDAANSGRAKVWYTIEDLP